MSWVAILFFMSGDPTPPVIVDRLRSREDCVKIVEAWQGKTDSGYLRVGRCVQVHGMPR